MMSRRGDDPTEVGGDRRPHQAGARAEVKATLCVVAPAHEPVADGFAAWCDTTGSK